MDIAQLGVSVTSNGIEEVNTGLQKLATTAGQAEKATDSLDKTSADAAQSFKQEAAAADQAAASVKNLATASSGLGVNMSGPSGIKQLTKDVDGLGKATGKLRPDEILNFGRQLSDIGVTASMGMNPLMILIQQGPQLADIFASAGQRGVGFSQALGGIASGLGLTNPLVLAAAAAVGVLAGGFALFAADTNKLANNKEFIKTLGLTEQELKKLKDTSVTAGDMIKGLWKTIDEGGRVSKVFTQIKDVAITAFRFILDAGKWTIAGIYGGWVGGIKAIIDTVKNLPAIVGDVFISAANLAITGVEYMVNRSISAINGFIDLANKIPGVDLGRMNLVQLGRINNPYAGAAGRQIADNIKAIGDEAKNAAGAIDAFTGAWQKNSIAVSRDRLKAQADALKSARRETGAAGRGRQREAASVLSKTGNREDLLNDSIKVMTEDERKLQDVLDGRTKILTEINDQLSMTSGLIDPIKQKWDQFGQGVSRVGMDISYAFGDAIARGQSFGDSMKRILQDLLAQWLAMKAMGFLGIDSQTGDLKQGGAIDKGVNWLASAFGGKRETGGPVEPGKAYLVGEKRPEMFVPKQPGYILPRVPQMGGGNVNYAPALSFSGVTTGQLMAEVSAALDRDRRRVLDQARRALPGQMGNLNKLGTTRA